MGVLFPFVSRDRSFLGRASPVRKVADKITWMIQMEGRRECCITEFGLSEYV